MYRPHAPAWRPRHTPAPAPPPAPRPTPRAEDRQPQEGIEASRRRQAPSILATPYPVASSSADGQAPPKASKKVEAKRRRRERELQAARQAATAAAVVTAAPAAEEEQERRAKGRGLWHDVRGLAPVARPSRPWVQPGVQRPLPTAPRAMRPPMPPTVPQEGPPANDVQDEEEYLNSLPSSSVPALSVLSPAPVAPLPQPEPARPPQCVASSQAEPLPTAPEAARTSRPARPPPPSAISARSPMPSVKAEPVSQSLPLQAVLAPSDGARGKKRSNALAFSAEPSSRPPALPSTTAPPVAQHLDQRDPSPSVRRRSRSPIAVDAAAAVPGTVELLSQPSVKVARLSPMAEREASISSPPVRAPVVKVEKAQIDHAIPAPAAAAPTPSPPPSWNTSGAAPVEQPDIKPVVRRRSPSPPAPPPPSNPDQGVTSWTKADVPAECNLSGPLRKAERDRARRRFRLRREWDLQNECKVITNARWISGGLSLDWRVDRTQGTFTALYPADLGRAGGAEAKRAFLEREVARAEQMGWSIICAGEKTASEGGPVGITISWEANDRTPPSPPAKPPPPSEAMMSTAPESTETSSVESSGPKMSTAAPPSSSSQQETSARSPVPAPVAPGIRVKPEPMDVDVLSIPPPIATLAAALPSLPHLSSSAAPPPLASATVKSKPEPTGSLVAVLQDELSKSIALLVDLRAVDVDPHDLRAVDRARAHNAWLFEELAQAQTRIDERLGEMADRIMAKQGDQPQ